MDSRRTRRTRPAIDGANSAKRPSRMRSSRSPMRPGFKRRCEPRRRRRYAVRTRRANQKSPRSGTPAPPAHRGDCGRRIGAARTSRSPPARTSCRARPMDRDSARMSGWRVLGQGHPAARTADRHSAASAPSAMHCPNRASATAIVPTFGRMAIRTFRVTEQSTMELCRTMALSVGPAPPLACGLHAAFAIGHEVDAPAGDRPRGCAFQTE